MELCLSKGNICSFTGNGPSHSLPETSASVVVKLVLGNLVSKLGGGGLMLVVV